MVGVLSEVMEEPVGRRRQQRLLDEVLARVVTSGRRVVHVHGPPGIGKSTVLADIRHRAVAGGWAVVETGLSEAETGLSWAGLAVLLRPLPDAVVEGVPSAQRAALGTALGHDDGAADPLLVAGAATYMLESLASAAPLLVIVDDLHWLDQATAGALSYAIRATDTARIAFVLASRPVALPVDLRRVTPTDRFVDLPLDGLSVAGLKALLDQRCDVQLHRVELIRLHDTTGGNPLHSIEAGRLLSSGQPLEHSLVPPSLRAVVDEHLGLLPESAMAVLRAAALLARPDLEALEALFPAEEVEAALIVAEQALIVAIDGETVRFCHPTYVTGLVEQLGTLERRRFERRLAEVVTDQEEQVLHRAAATAGADESVAGAMEGAAAAAARRGALHLAVERSARALELTPVDDPASLRRRRLLLADRLDTGGDGARALPLYRQVLESQPTDNERWSAAVGVTLATCHAYGEPAGVDTLPLLDAAAGDDPARRAQALRLRMRIHLHLDVAEGERAARAWADLVRGEESATDGQRVEAEVALAIVRVLRAEPVDMAALRRLALDTWPDDPLRATSMLSEPLVWTDHLVEVVDALRQLVEVAEHQGRTLVLLNALDQLGDALTRLGRWAEAATCLEQFRDLGMTAFDGMGVAPREAELAYLDALRGRPPLGQLLPVSRTLSKAEQAQLLCRRGSIALLAGDAAAAAVDLTEADLLLRSVGMSDPGVLIFRCDLVQALLEVGRLDDALIETARLEEAAQRSGRRRAAADAARAAAMVHATQGDLVAAAAKCETARAGYRELLAPYEEGRTVLLAGAVARRAGRRSDAKELLTAARGLFESLGALPFVRRTDEESARVAGVSTGGITPTERQIAQLVVAGKSNAQIASILFVSVRTVESNLTKVYRKVGVRSRTELVAHLASRAMD